VRTPTGDSDPSAAVAYRPVSTPNPALPVREPRADDAAPPAPAPPAPAPPAPAPALRWALLRCPPASGAANMAVDEALLERARRTGEATLRVYAWARPTLSFGRHQKARDFYDAERLREAGVDVVRRPTGGRALLHDREVTYAVAAPETHGRTLRESYARINRLLVDALRALGVEARVASPTGRAPLPDGAPCFETATGGELVVGEAKLVGSAQWRQDGALLQHGSILVDDDQTLLAALASRALPVVSPPATLRGALGRAPSMDEVADALFAAVRAREDAGARPLAMDAELLADVSRLQARYESDRWTWRR
jgi:lipoate-protein ligase A